MQNPPNHGAFLFSLEPELCISSETASEAILVASLFARQVCLNESHVLDNRAVWDFFAKNSTRLQTMLKNLEPDEVPIVGLCVRSEFARNIEGLLEDWLEPEEGIPIHFGFSALSPEQNDMLRQKPYPTTPRHRRERLYRVAPEFKSLVENLTQYFQGPSLDTTVERTGDPRKTLYESVTKEIKLWKDSATDRVIIDEDKAIADRLKEAIAALPVGEVPTRNRLHFAIYGGVQPYVHNGVTKQGRGTAAPGQIKDEWRFFINSIYNYNLTKQLHLRGVLNTPWWAVGQRWFLKESFNTKFGLRPVGKLSLPIPLYRDCLSFEFVVKVRKLARFRDSLSKLEAARNDKRPDQVDAALREHLSFLSEQLKMHLVEIGKSYLIGPRLVDLAVSAADKVSLATVTGGPALTGLMLEQGLPPDAIFEGLKTTVDGGHIVGSLVKGLFKLAPSIGNRPVRNTQFKNMIAAFGKASGY